MEFPTTSLMAHLFLALFLIVFGLNLLFGLSIPIWVTGLLALIAGILLVMDHFRVHMDPKWRPNPPRLPQPLEWQGTLLWPSKSDLFICWGTPSESGLPFESRLARFSPGGSTGASKIETQLLSSKSLRRTTGRMPAMGL